MAEASVKTRKIAIITGASAGLGAEFALQIEKANFLDEIWMIARRSPPMRELAEKFLKSRAVVITCDLTSK
jgi:NADP-dependent 3-hydroxy acid dehydrogenase YdfG